MAGHVPTRCVSLETCFNASKNYLILSLNYLIPLQN